MRALARVWPGVALAALSLMLFAYVGYGEATRVYVQIRLERLTQLGATVQASVDQFAKSGLPLDQFGGFQRRAEQLRTVDPAILGTSLVDVRGRPVFCEAEASATDQFCHAESRADPARQDGHASPFRDLPLHDLRIDLPIRDKFGVVGAVVLHIDRARIEQTVDEAFRPVFLVSAGLFVAFALARLTLAWRGVSRLRWLTPMFLAVIAVNLLVLVAVMFDLYRRGTEGQAEALARSMADRLSAATELGIPLTALSGVGEALDEYRRINPNIAAISLVQRDQVIFSVDTAADGQAGVQEGLHRLTFTLPVFSETGQQLVLSVQLPLSVVIEALGSGARNFVALFFGCVVFALVFLRAVREGQASPVTGVRDPDARLALLRPAYFLGIFADALSLSMLPEISQEAVAAAGLPSSWVSLPFTLFFIGLTAALLPASYVTGRVELRRLFTIGAAAVGGGLFLIALVPEFWMLCAGRALGGAGQGILLVAVQAYAFTVVGPGQRTKAAAVQVLGYNGGLIVGTGLGGLLAVFNPDHEVLFLGGLVAVATCLYIRFVLPPLVQRTEEPSAGLLGSVGRLARAPDFMAVLGMVGITSKFALAGIAMFAMPLVLHDTGYEDDEVGQALMVFAVVAYLVTGVAPRLVARVGSIDGVLVLGMVMLAVGIGSLGLLLAPAPGAVVPAFVPAWVSQAAASVQSGLAASPIPVAAGLAVAAAIAALGVGQGLIAAPVVARIAESHAAHEVGRDRTLAVYRLAERAGHILGPTLVGPLLLAAHGDATALTLFGVVFAGLAVAYALSALSLRSRSA